ncbi:hypothetical protein M2451_002420 [Dysgonomonas sp. PFB1-18]|nr:hypothetical protein [Dysgonomonas sp. PF1-14]MDH6337105.1 hypothetical protein [Dysgonomonas sp. PF1-16]MDH6381091.1 hypothetical protein [Dysgonomonas sp. PFB1-18]MDH6396330.1 hypothetical protein [Dysgonomonas sp. PF1-23]
MPEEKNGEYILLILSQYYTNCLQIFVLSSLICHLFAKTDDRYFSALNLFRNNLLTDYININT